MGQVKVKVLKSNLLTGPSPSETTQYKKGQEFICSEEDAIKLSESVIIVEKIAEPEIIPEPEKEKRTYKK